MNKSQALAIYALVASFLLVGAVIAVLTTQKTISGAGYVKSLGVGVYWNPECTNATSSVDFGGVEPGFSSSFTLYLRNEGNSDLNLSMSSENWDPANASDYMTLTWNREGQQISPDEVIEFVITLSVSEDIEGISSFSLDMIVSGTG